MQMNGESLTAYHARKAKHWQWKARLVTHCLLHVAKAEKDIVYYQERQRRFSALARHHLGIREEDYNHG